MQQAKDTTPAPLPGHSGKQRARAEESLSGLRQWVKRKEINCSGLAVTGFKRYVSGPPLQHQPESTALARLQCPMWFSSFMCHSQTHVEPSSPIQGRGWKALGTGGPWEMLSKLTWNEHEQEQCDFNLLLDDFLVTARLS